MEEQTSHPSATAEVVALAFPLFDRLLVLDFRPSGAGDPVAVYAAAALTPGVQPGLMAWLRELFAATPSLLFSRQRLFAGLDLTLGRLTVAAALELAGRPAPAEGETVSFARVMVPTKALFASPLWETIAERWRTRWPGRAGDLATVQEELAAAERRQLQAAEEAERRRLLRGEGYLVVRPKDAAGGAN